MNGKYTNIKVTGIASAVPTYVMDNMDYVDLYGKRRVLKQAKLTGVYRHHMSFRYQKISDLAMRAAEDLLNHLQWNREEIKILLLCTQWADYEIPSTAIDLASRLGFGKDCMAYDMNLGCSAYDLGIQSIGGLLQSQPDGTKAVLLVGDIVRLPAGVILSEEEIINTMMFGSGAAAIAVEKKPESEFVFRNYSDGSGWDAIVRYDRTATMMKGNRVFEYAINDVAENLDSFQEDLNLREKTDFYVFHQAQKLILQSISDSCGLPEDKVLTSFEEYGNTSGASIPITICHNRDKFGDRDSVRICSCGFGVGLSTGISYYEVPVGNILPVIETDEHYDGHRMHNGFLYTRRALVMNPGTPVSQMIVRQLDRVGCNLGLYGDKDTIDGLRSQLFWKDCDMYSEGLEKAAGDITEKYDAVIFDMAVHGEDEIKDTASFLQKNKALADNCSIILVAEDKGNDDAMRAYMDTLSGCLDQECRVNAVVYKPESFDMFPDIGDSPAWLERKVQIKDSADMSRPFFLTAAVSRLISLDFLAISGTIVHISDSIKKFS